MFRTVPLFIITSFSLYTQQWYMSYCMYSVWHIPLLCVQWKTPDDGQRNCPKHVEFYSKNKFSEISASSWFYYKNFLNVSNYGHAVPLWDKRITKVFENILLRECLDVKSYLMGTFIICILLPHSNGGRWFGKVTLLWKYRMDTWWYTLSRETSGKYLRGRPVR